MLYSATTFVFENPSDLYCFQVTASPQGLAGVKSLIMTPGKIDWPNIGPFHNEEEMKDWGLAFQNLDKLHTLRELQVWFYHGHFNIPKEPVWPQRPWGEIMQNQAVEERHKRLFYMFGNLNVPNFTINLTWNPEDLLSQREWPFKISVQTNDNIYRGMMKFPYPVEPNMYN